MNDPKRLLDEGTELEARLLGSAMDDAPRRGLDRRVQVALGIGGATIGAGTASSTAAAASKAAVSLGIAKWAGILVLGTGAVVGGAVLRRQVSEPAASSVGVGAVPQTPARMAKTPIVDIPAPPPLLSAAPAPTVAPEPRAALPTAGHPQTTVAPVATEKAAPELAAQLASIDRAKAALDSGDTQLALMTLDRYDLEFAPGDLAPESLALRVQAYALRHDDAKVAELGTRFLARYPGDPEARRVAALVKASHGL